MDLITVRHAELSDAEALQKMFSDPALYRDTLQIPYPPLKTWTDRLSNIHHGSRNLVACINNKIVGQLMLLPELSPRRSHVATFGMGVETKSRGKGVATSLVKAMIELCDNWLRIERIELTVFVDNEPALAVYRKFGFVIEGTAKKYGLREGEFVDAYHMARYKPATY